MEEYHKLNIKNWALEERPREKLLCRGTSSLSDAELVAILIGSGNSGETAVELSRRLGWLSAVDVARVRALMQRAGLPVKGADLGAERYLELMSHDKKVIAGNLRLVLLKALGNAVTFADAPRAGHSPLLELHTRVDVPKGAAWCAHVPRAVRVWLARREGLVALEVDSPDGAWSAERVP